MISVSAKIDLFEWGTVRASANVSRNPFYGFNEPGEPEFDIESLLIRDQKNRVIHGRAVIEKNTLVFNLSAFEVQLVEEALIEAFEAAEEEYEDAKTDTAIETIRAFMG